MNVLNSYKIIYIYFFSFPTAGHGTKVGDVWVKPNAPRQLQLGTVVSFGASTRTYRVVGLDKV